LLHEVDYKSVIFHYLLVLLDLLEKTEPMFFFKADQVWSEKTTGERTIKSCPIKLPI